MIEMNYIKSEETLMYKYRISAWAISGLCHKPTISRNSFLPQNDLQTGMLTGGFERKADIDR